MHIQINCLWSMVYSYKLRFIIGEKSLATLNNLIKKNIGRIYLFFLSIGHRTFKLQVKTCTKLKC